MQQLNQSVFPPDIKRLGPVLVVFFMVSLLAIGGGFLYPDIGLDWPLILYANIILLAINLLAYIVVRVSMHNKNPNVFVRSIMGAMFLKMFLVVAVVLLYVTVISDGKFHKPSLFIAISLYLVYLAALCYCLIIYNKNLTDSGSKERNGA